MAMAGMVFRGSFEHTLDAKGRLAMPARFRDLFAQPAGGELYLTCMEGSHVRLYPLSVWEELEAKLALQPFTEESSDQYLLLAAYYGQEATLDGAGRLLIPAKLRERAGIDKDVTLLGKIRHIEVWDRCRLAAQVAEIEPTLRNVRQHLSTLGI